MALEKGCILFRQNIFVTFVKYDLFVLEMGTELEEKKFVLFVLLMF